MKIYFVLIFILTTQFLWSQNLDYFHRLREYTYKAVYLGNKGDTITSEKMIIKPKGKRWFVQPSLQKSIEYQFFTDTLGYKKWEHPIPYFQERNLKYYKKKGKYRIKSKSITGGFENDSVFYMHPPRTNQYRMLFYAPHFYIRYDCIKDSMNSYNSGITIYGMGTFNHHNSIIPLPDTIINNEKVKAWNLLVTSTGDIKERNKAEGIYNSKMDAIFTKEFGFIKVHYTFENGIKIQFDLEKVSEY